MLLSFCCRQAPSCLQRPLLARGRSSDTRPRTWPRLRRQTSSGNDQSGPPRSKQNGHILEGVYVFNFKNMMLGLKKRKCVKKDTPNFRWKHFLGQKTGRKIKVIEIMKAVSPKNCLESLMIMQKSILKNNNNCQGYVFFL